ncbi:MAG: hypothetical protein ACMUEL_05830 [Flavobacteriales bacterium Tduv]
MEELVKDSIDCMRFCILPIGRSEPISHRVLCKFCNEIAAKKLCEVY